jgi:hypothetical protein
VTDLVSKLDSLKAYEHLTVDIQIPGLTRLATELERQLKPLDRVEKIWKNLGRDLKEIEKREIELTEQKKKLTKEIDHINDLNAVDVKNGKTLEKDYLNRIERLKELEEQFRYTDSALKKFNATQLSRAAIFQHSKVKAIEFAEKGLGFLAKMALGASTVAFAALEKSMMGVYNLNEKFRASFAAMAMTIGGASPDLGKFQKQSESLYFDKGGLGDLGMGIEQITAEMSSFVSQLGILDKAMTDNSKTLLTHGRVVGLSGAEVGDAARNMMLMGQSAEDLDGLLAQLNKDSKALGVSSALLSKNVLVLGKNLLALAGPKFQQQMVKAIEKFTKMGISVGSLERFTDMSDSFDKAAESMARLNTVFGTHINALEMFAEQDPAKRFKMITDQMFAQGVQLDSLSRQERKFLADTIGLSVEETNAMLKWAKGGENVEEKLKQAEKQTADWNTGMMELKSTLVTWGRIVDKIFRAVMKAAEPLLNVFGISGELGNGFMTIGQKAEQFGDRVAEAIAKLAKNEKAQAAFRNMARVFQDLATRIMAFVSSPDFPNFIANVLAGLSKLVSILGSFAATIINNAPMILGFFSFLVNNTAELVALWAAFKGVGIAIQFGLALQTMAGAAGIASTSFGALALSVWSVLWPILAVIAAIYAAYKAYKFFSQSQADQSAQILATSEEAQMLGVTPDMAPPSNTQLATGTTGVTPSPGAAQNPSAGLIDNLPSMPGFTPPAGTTGFTPSTTPMSVPQATPAPQSAPTPMQMEQGEWSVPNYPAPSGPQNTPQQNFTPTSMNAQDQIIHVQVHLDSEVIQDRMYRRNLRSA